MVLYKARESVSLFSQGRTVSSLAAQSIVAIVSCVQTTSHTYGTFECRDSYSGRRRMLLFKVSPIREVQNRGPGRLHCLLSSSAESVCIWAILPT